MIKCCGKTFDEKTIQAHARDHIRSGKFVQRGGHLTLARNARVQGYQSCTCRQGHNHHSRAEAGYCNELDLKRRAALSTQHPTEIREVRVQVRISLDVPLAGTKETLHITNHYIDFEVELYNGRFEWHEVKGWSSEVWQIKKRLCEALHPGVPYITIKV